MSKDSDFPESVKEELEQYVNQLTQIRSSAALLAASDAQREIITEVDALLERFQTKDLAATLKSDELCALSDRVIAVHDRNLMLVGERSQGNA